MVLPYELEVLDNLISETIHPKKIFDEKTVISPRQFAAWETTAKLQFAKVRKRLKPVAYSFSKERHKKLYVKRQQSATIYLLDLLFHYLYPAKAKDLEERNTDTKIEKLYKRIFKECHRLLNFIQDTFPTSWDLDQKIPDSEMIFFQQQSQVRLVTVKRKLARLKADKRILKLLFELLDPITDNTSAISLSYRSLAYTSELITALENLKPGSTTANICPPLNVLVIYLNLNSTEFKDYIADCICSEVNTMNSVKEKLDRLFFYYKHINQMHTKPGVALIQDARSVKDEIKEWLAGEIRYLQKTQNLGIIVPARFKNETEYKQGIWCTYTVEEIALLHRLQHEAKFITNKKVRPMIDDLSKFIHTSSVHNISAKNLYNSFYNIDLDTIQSLNDKLFTLISHLRKLESQVKRKAREKQSPRKISPL
ncbi:MAG TPA: hypothetical protein PKC72_07200 [Chitinophagaceae bacterium]|nr:hypothetical protein [Chitinophagaceae bacterium]